MLRSIVAFWTGHDFLDQVLAEIHDGPIDSQLLKEYYGDLPDKIGMQFKSTHVAFVDSNEDVAHG